MVAITVLAKFIQDDTLYEYGEHLLTLRFYRQLIYTLVILPLVLLVPLFNAASALLLSGRRRAELASSVTGAVSIWARRRANAWPSCELRRPPGA